jgi:hypothetical protein
MRRLSRFQKLPPDELRWLVKVLLALAGVRTVPFELLRRACPPPVNLKARKASLIILSGPLDLDTAISLTPPAMPFSFSERVIIAPDVLFCSVGEETVLLNLRTELYLGFDNVGARIWSALQESGSIQEAFDKLLGEYEVEAAQLRRDLEEFLAQLREQRLIEIAPGGSVQTA